MWWQCEHMLWSFEVSQHSHSMLWLLHIIIVINNLKSHWLSIEFSWVYAHTTTPPLTTFNYIQHNHDLCVVSFDEALNCWIGSRFVTWSCLIFKSLNYILSLSPNPICYVVMFLQVFDFNKQKIDIIIIE